MFALDTFLDVKDDPSIRIPKEGDKVVLTDEFFEGMSDGKESARLARLPYCTVESVDRVPIGQDGDYTWQYSIYVNETGYIVGLGYEFYKEK